MANFVLTYENTGGSVGIEVVKPDSLVAPAQVWLKAIDYDGLAPFEETGPESDNIYDGAFHEYDHEWTINGEPLPAWSKPVNLLAEHNNPNKMFGREVAFCLPTPGHYVINLVVTDRLGGRAFASTQTLIVFDPESYFPPADRIYIAPDGDFTGVPAASEKIQTLEELRTTAGSRNTNPTWVLLKRGQDHTLTGVDVGNTSTPGTLYIERFNDIRMISGYGTGAKPRITIDTRADRPKNNPMLRVPNPLVGNWRTITGVDFIGERDAGTEHGPGPYNGGASSDQWVKNGFSLLHDSYMTGLNQGHGGSGIDPNSSATWHRHMMADCEVDGWQTGGVYVSGPSLNVSFLGVRVAQDSQTPNNGASDGIRANLGPIRIGVSSRVHMSGCDLFSRNHWDAADQPCLRLFTTLEDDGQERAVVERCSMEGGYEVLQLANRLPATNYAVNVLFDRLLLVSSSYSSKIAVIARSGVTLRNSVLVWTDAPTSTYPGLAGAIGIFKTNTATAMPGLYTHPIAIYGNTILNLLSDTNDGTAPYDPVWIQDGESTPFTTVIEENNVHHRPFGGTVVDTYAPIDTSTAISGFTSQYLGNRHNFEYPEITLTADVDPGESFTVSYSLIGDGEYGGAASTGPTDQAYWLTNAGTRHQVTLKGMTVGETYVPLVSYYDELGHIDVSFGATEVTITNNTPTTWYQDQVMRVWLDRSSVQPAMQTAYANPPAIPLPRPQSGSPAIGAATAGRISPRDFLLTNRGQTPSRGALEPAP